MKLIITVDTEADNQWKRGEDVSLENIRFLPRFQALCEKFGFSSTYFVTYEIADDASSSELLVSFQKGGNAEIGAHLHPWTTPPYDKDVTWERKHHRFPNELSEYELSLKMKSLTDRITTAFEQRPTSFRAGRWGFNDNVATILNKLGYISDYSITPHVSWKRTKGDPDGVGGPDFRKARAFPHMLFGEGNSNRQEHNLIEVPMTILPVGIMRTEGSRFQALLSALDESPIQRFLDRALFRYRWFRIFPETKVADLKSVYHSAVLNGLPALVFMTHSSELMPGGSPYAKDKDMLEHTYVVLEELLAFLAGEGVEGAMATPFALSLGRTV